jgi:hypothetical protein
MDISEQLQFACPKRSQRVVRSGLTALYALTEETGVLLGGAAGEIPTHVNATVAESIEYDAWL